MNLFRNKKQANKTVKVTVPKAGVTFPFSKSNNSDKKGNSAYNLSDDKKTRIGRQSDMAFGQKGDRNPISCPKCGYLLIIEPSFSSPCPNCGQSGDTGTHDTASDSKKTIAVSSLDLENEDRLSAFRFKMISESSGSEYKIESEETEVILSREHLDPNNTSISSKGHLVFRFRDGKIYVMDISSTGTTFVQVNKKQIVNPGTRIVLGNKIFLFSGKQQVHNKPDNKATRQLSMLSQNIQIKDDCILIEETTGRRINLSSDSNLLNRNNLDPGNSSISGNKHATLEFKDGQWFITDLSSNAATFKQCITEQQMTNKIRLIVGNIIFRFEYD